MRGYTMKTSGTVYAFGKETTQDMKLESVVRDGDRFLKVTIGAMYFFVKGDAVEAAMTMREVERLHKEIERLKNESIVYISENKYLMRQVDFLMETFEGKALEELKKSNRAPYKTQRNS